VLIPTAARRPSAEQLQTAYATVPQDVAPIWETGQPRCPRCGGQMFLERFEHEVVRRGDRGLRRAS